MEGHFEAVEIQNILRNVRENLKRGFGGEMGGERGRERYIKIKWEREMRRWHGRWTEGDCERDEERKPVNTEARGKKERSTEFGYRLSCRNVRVLSRWFSISRVISRWLAKTSCASLCALTCADWLHAGGRRSTVLSVLICRCVCSCAFLTEKIDCPWRGCRPFRPWLLWRVPDSPASRQAYI